MILTRENIKAIDVDLVINQKLAEGKISDILFIVPTNRKVRNLKKELIAFSPNLAAYRINIETLSTISTKILSLSRSFHQISEAASTVFIKQISSQIKLRYLSIYREEIPSGTLDKIRNVISEYKRHGIIAGTLRREAENLELNEKNKALDIADIMEEYTRKCKSLNAFDLGDVYEELNLLAGETFIKNFRTIFGNVDSIFLDGFSEFTSPEIEIIHSLSNCSRLFAGFDYEPNNGLLFSHLEKCFTGLSQKGFKEITDLRSTSTSGFQILLREKLFKYYREKKIDYGDRIFEICGYNKEKEIELIAKQIKLILTNEKTEAHKICVAFNLVQEYSSVIKDLFVKIGIPFNLTDRTPLQNSDPVTAIVNFLEVAESDYYFKNVFRAIYSGFIEIAVKDAANLYRVAAEHKIVSGKQNWLDSIDDALTNLINARDEEELNIKRDELNRARTDFKKIVNLLEPFESKLTIGEFQERLNEFIVKSKLPYKVLNLGEDKESNVRSITEFLETVNEIFDLQKEEFGNNKKFKLNYYLEQIRTACGWARFNVKEKSDYGVLVTSLEEIRGLKFDYLFISGLCDGLLPTRFNPEIFSSGSYKKQAYTHQTEERFLFYRALCSWQQKLYLSYHQNENGRETVKSTFLKELQSLISIKTINENDFSNILFCDEELQIEFGKYRSKDINDILAQFVKSSIENSLIVEKKRFDDPYGSSSFCGNIISADDLSIDHDDLAQIEKKLFGYIQKQYSISQLENYAKCPFKFFVERVLKIETFEEPTEDIEAIEMGRLLHTILFEFYSKLVKENIVLQQCNDSDFAKAKKLMFSIAEKNLHGTAFKSPLTFYEKEKILGLDGNETDSVLYRFLINERAGDKDYIPKFFEVGFGRLHSDDADDNLGSAEAIMIDDIKLRGKIDRIEIDEENSSFNVVDYKLSGKKPSFSDLKEGISLQLPLYLYAASELLSQKFKRKFSPNEMFIYSLKYNADGFGKDKVSLGNKKETRFNSVDELIGSILEHIKNYIRKISLGEFNLSKLEDRESKVCRFCQFRLACRVDDLPV